MKKYLRNVIKNGPIVLFLIVSYIILGPLEIYIANTKDFEFGYADFFFRFLFVGIVLWILGTLILSLFHGKIGTFFGSAAIGFSIASYIQNMFINKDIVSGTGGYVDWSNFTSRIPLNDAIWVIIIVATIAVAFVCKDKWDKIGAAIGLFFSAIQLVAVISLLVRAVSIDKNVYAISGDDQFKVAPNSNVIVLVPDSFGSAWLDRVVEQFPDALDEYHDFTYYNNADCHYYRTFPAMTNMLTGVNLDTTTDVVSWTTAAWSSNRANDFYDTLGEMGYTRNLYSIPAGYVYGGAKNLLNHFDNIVVSDRIIEKNRIFKQLFKMSIYRYVPYQFKPRFEVITENFKGTVEYTECKEVREKNSEFYDALMEEGLSVDESMDNAFIVEHFFGLHDQWYFNENCQWDGAADRIRGGKGVLVMMTEYINQLKELGLYDNATIIITADHGNWDDGDVQPIYFIKRANEHHDSIQVSSAPIWHDDFQATIMDLLGQDYSEYGTSIYDWKDGDIRERCVYRKVTRGDMPSVVGSDHNAYQIYTYSGDKYALYEKVNAGDYQVVPALPWY